MWGYHLTIDCAGCNANISNHDALAAFARDMVDALDMKAYGEPQLVRFGDDPKVTGYTLIQLIETSNISGHFCDYSGEAYIDVFSCKAFEAEAALAVVQRHFAPADYVTSYQERQAPVVPMPQAANG